MTNNLPQKYKNNIFQKILQKIRKIFFAKKEKISENKDNKKVLEKASFINEIKVKELKADTEIERKKFIEKLTNNPDLLEEFSNERLEKILQYYKEENNKKRELLKKLIA